MRLLRLDLEAFGSLSGKSITFASRPRVLSVVYGPNEAGKSTSLRAIFALLYGIPSSSPDGHSTPGGEIKVSGTLVSDAGTTERIRRRRKGRSTSLTTDDDRRIEEGTLAATFALPDVETFRSLYGLDHLSLREGAALVLDARGRVGELLFDAARMGPSASRVLRDLDEEAEALFAPLARKRPLNEAIRTFAELDKKTRLEALDVEAYERQVGAIAQAGKEAETLEAERKRLALELEGKRDLTRIVPLVRDKRRIALSRAALARGAALPLAAFEERRRATQDITDGTALLSVLGAERSKIEQAQAEMAPEDPILAQADIASDLRAAAAVLASLEEESAKRAARKETLIARLEGAPSAACGADDLSALHARLASVATTVARVERDELELAHADERLVELIRSLGEEIFAHEIEAVPSVATFAARREEVLARAAEARALVARADEIAVRVASHERAGVPPATDAGDRVQQVEVAQQRVRDAVSKLAVATHGTSYAPLVADLREHTGALDRGVAALLGARGEDDAARRARADLEASRRALVEAEGARDAALQAYRAVMTAHGFREMTLEEVAARLERGASNVARAAGLIEARAARAKTAAASREEAGAALRHMRAAIADAGLPSDGDLDALRGLLERALASRGLRDELAIVVERERARDAARARVDALLRRIQGAEATEPSPTVEDVLARLARARKDVDARAAASARHALLSDRIARENERVAAGRAKLASLASAAGVRIEELDLAEAKAGAIEALASDEREVDEKLEMLAKRSLTSEDVTALEKIDVDAVELEIEELQQRIAEIAQRRDNALRDVGRNEAGLRDLEKETSAAEYAVLAEAELQRVRDLGRRYATLRLARALLAEEIERYRKENEGPVLERAREIFGRLTLGRFDALIVDALSGPTPELRCRSGEDLLEVEALSEGTRDQLYLALRIATLEHLATTRESVPFVLDDVLVHFDEDRAKVALSILGEAAARFQVVLFTHQRRVVELAEAALPAGSLEVHAL